MITMELIKADHTDAHNERFTEAALKAIADEFEANPEKLKAIPVSKSFDPLAIPIGHVVAIEYRDKALWVTLDDKAQEIANAGGLEAAAGGLEAAAGGMCDCETAGVHRKPGAGPLMIEKFQLNQVALVKDKVK